MFDFMITPWIIRILYWILQIIVIVLGLIQSFYQGLFDEFLRHANVLGGLLFIIIGTLVLRLFFEMLMVQFKISENTSKLKEIMNNNKNQSI